MNYFNELVSDKLTPFFKREGFKIKEKTKDVVKYELDKFIITLSHNQREKSNILWLSQKESINIEINDQIINDFFNDNLKLSNLSIDIFVNNVYTFFKSVGNNFLKENRTTLLNNLENFVELKSEHYTSKLLDSQNLEAAENAWKEKKYLDFTRLLEKINKDDLSKSYKQKYTIAKKKLNL